jgi:acetyl-CoA acyltransferase
LDGSCIKFHTKESFMKAVISAYARSPFHFAKKGALAEVRPDTLAAGVVRGLLQRTDLDPALLEDIILGCAYPEASQGNNLARIVGLLAGCRTRWAA